MGVVRGIAVTIAVAVGLVASLWIGEPHGVVLFTVYAGTGAYLAIRRPANHLGWLLILVAWGFGLGSAGTYSLPVPFDPVLSPRLALVAWASSTGWTLIFLGLLAITLTYPDGRLAPGRGGRLARAALAAQTTLALLIMVSPTLMVTTNAVMSFANPFAVLPDLVIWQVIPSHQGLYPMMLVLVVAGLVSMLGRWRRARGLERQQFRWLVTALVLLSVSTTVWAWVTFGLGQPPNGPANLLAVMSFSSVPAAIAVAVLRYRLYEIDRIISRTVSWAIITGGLLLVFVGLVFALQALLADHFQGGGTVAVAASTLVAFALFQPLRRRVQRAVDRRFDRARYDAEHTAAMFAERLRDEIDLETLTAELRATAAAAVRPREATVWLPSRGDR